MDLDIDLVTDVEADTSTLAVCVTLVSFKFRMQEVVHIGGGGGRALQEPVHVGRAEEVLV